MKTFTLSLSGTDWISLSGRRVALEESDEPSVKPHWWNKDIHVVQATDEAHAVRLLNLRRATSRTVTKLTIMRRLDALGKWATFKSVLATLPAVVQDAWALANEISDADPLFVQNAVALRTALGLTESQIEGLFNP